MHASSFTLDPALRSGGGAGFTTELRIYPEFGIGIALGMNMMRMPVTMRAAHRICEALLARLGGGV